MAGLLGGAPTAAPPLTARPATASDGNTAVAPVDMSAALATYLGGCDHLKMSGSEYYSLVAWLKVAAQSGSNGA